MICLIYDYIIEDYNATMKVEGGIKFLTYTFTSDIVEVKNTTFMNSYDNFSDNFLLFLNPEQL